MRYQKLTAEQAKRAHRNFVQRPGEEIEVDLETRKNRRIFIYLTRNGRDYNLVDIKEAYGNSDEAENEVRMGHGKSIMGVKEYKV